MQPIWIWPEDSGSVNAYARFEGTFVCEKREAFAGVSTTGEYVLTINGALAGFGQYPDWQECRTENVHDLSAFVRSGENRFELRVWHPGLDSQTTIACEPGAHYRVWQGENTLLRFKRRLPKRRTVSFRPRSADYPAAGLQLLL